MDRSTLFVITLGAVCILAGYVAYGMFAVGTMDKYEMSKMYFAAAILAFLAFVFMLSIIVYALGPEATPTSTESPGKIIFDACVKIIPPMVTLIIGFYFGMSQGVKEPESPKTKPAALTTASGKATEPDKTTEPGKTTESSK